MFIPVSHMAERRRLLAARPGLVLPAGVTITAPSSGDARMLLVSDGDDARKWARAKAANELWVDGALRAANVLPSLTAASFTKTKSGTDAVTPVATDNFVTDPVYGPAMRIQLDAGSSNAANYSWLWHSTNFGSNRRARVGVSCWLKLNTGTSAVLLFARGLGTNAAITVTNVWQRFYLAFSIAAGEGLGWGIGWVVTNGGLSARSIDFLVAMTGEYAPVCEVLTDERSPRPDAGPATSYGFGASGARYLPDIAAIPADFSLSDVSFFDDFNRADTSLGQLGTNAQSRTWEPRDAWNGSTMPAATQGLVRNKAYVMDPPASGNRACYARMPLLGAAKRIGAALRWTTNTGANQGPWGFVWALIISPLPNAVLNMVHFIGTHITWSFELWLANGTQVYLANGTFSPSLTYGKTYYFDLAIEGDVATITVPRQRVVVQDSRIPSCVGNYAVWEQFANGPTANVMEYRAAWAGETGQSALDQSVWAKWRPKPLRSGLRLLPAKTETMLQSVDPSNASWTKTNVTATASTTMTQKLTECQVWKIGETTADGLHGLSQATGLGAVEQTVTAIVKPVERGFVRLRLNNATDGDLAVAIFEITTEAQRVVSGPGALDDVLRDDVATISVTGTPTVAGTVAYLELMTDDSTASYAGTAGSGVLLYYMGSEAGPRFTAPIITTTGSVSRTAEDASLGAALGTDWTLVLRDLEVPDLATNRYLLGVDGSGAGDGLYLDSAEALQWSGTGGVVALGACGQGVKNVVVRKTGTSMQAFVGGVALSAQTVTDARAHTAAKPLVTGGPTGHFPGRAGTLSLFPRAMPVEWCRQRSG